MTKEEILDYITNTPENANRRVLSDMIDELQSGGGGVGGLVVEVEYFTQEDPFMLGFKSLMDATEIISAYKQGSNVVFHIPHDIEHASYIAEDWYTLVAYKTNDTSGYGPFAFAVPPEWASTTGITDDGKFYIKIYTD